MPSWPRTIVPARSTPPSMPGALQAFGQSGKGQTRATNNAGRIWTESYPVLDLAQPEVRAFLHTIASFWRNGTAFEIDHYDLRNNLGVGGGAPLVMGAGQFGASLVVDAAPVSTTNWLRQGDLIRVAGVAPVLDVAADVTTSAGGVATIPIEPPIPEGSEPADNAVVTIASVRFTCVLHANPLPSLGDLNQWSHLEGLGLTFREVL